MLAVGDWKICRWVSHLHLAKSLADGCQAPAAISRPAEILAAAEQLDHAFQSADREICWRWLIAAAADAGPDCQSLLSAFEQYYRDWLRSEPSRQLLLEPDSDGLPPPTANLAEPLREYLSLADQILDNAEYEIGLRMRPLREQWEARGPGLMKQISKLTGDTSASTPSILPVLPIQGGGGDIHFPFPSVRIEAVLANSIAALPEILRVGWLVAWWQSRHSFAALANSSCSDHLIALANIPLVLRAAEEIEISVCELESVALAIDHWHGDTTGPICSADQLFTWWKKVESSSQGWTDHLCELAASIE